MNGSMWFLLLSHAYNYAQPTWAYMTAQYEPDPACCIYILNDTTKSKKNKINQLI